MSEQYITGVKLTLLLLAVLLGLSACGTMQPYSYNDSDSAALNYAKAGKVSAVKDFNFTDAEIDALLTDWESVTDKGYRPKQQTTQNLIFAWVPLSSGDSKDKAMHTLSDNVATAIEDGLFALKITHKLDNRNHYEKLPGLYNYFFNNAVIENDSMGCPYLTDADLSKTCSISSIIVSPKGRASETPDFLNTTELAYAFNAADKLQYSELRLAFPKSSQYKRLDILTSISKNLPSWAFIYAPGVRVANGGYTAPLVFNQGAAHPFKQVR